jgi:two-component system, NtrC family, sensor kinase
MPTAFARKYRVLMKLAIKVALALMCAVLSVLAPFAYFRIEREVQLFDSDMRKDHALIGTTLAVSVGDVLFREGIERADELVHLADANRIGTQVRWRSATRWDEGLERQRFENLREPIHDVIRLHLTEAGERAADDGETFLRSFFPIRHTEQTLGVIELTTSYATRDQYVETSTINAIAATLLTVASAAGVMLAVGVVFIARPMRALVEKARRVGASDLSGPLVLRQKDEIGTLAHEMNAMCEQLADARHIAAQETSARERALEQLRHADRLITVGKLAAGVAHELGTPLNIISGRARMIVRGKVSGTTVLDYCQSIADQADRMTKIIHQLLDFSRRREPKLERVDLTQVVKDAVSLLTHMAQKKGVALTMQSGRALFAVVDPSQIQQVVTNLVINALQACEAGAATTVTVSSSTPTALTTEHGAGPWALIRVTDTGCGMSVDVSSHMFEPFFTTKDIGQGSGLGLSVVHGIVEEHRGVIQVDSQPNAGTTLSVYLPSAGEAIAQLVESRQD